MANNECIQDEGDSDVGSALRNIQRCVDGAEVAQWRSCNIHVASKSVDGTRKVNHKVLFPPVR